MVLIPGWGRYPGGGHSNPLQYSCLGNPKRSLVGYSPWGHNNWTMTATKPPPPPHIWFTMLYRFQHIVYSIVIQYFFRLCSILGYCKIIDTTPWLYSISLLSIYFICSSLYLLIPYLCVPPFFPLCFGDHKFVFCICEFVSALHIYSLVLFFRFHM